ncbi:hypothetical protein AcV7_008982 [Taiwanofungus camphoratus]|nr:hypothetical protein AcW2_004527 [Antrodia cinnamomea]KAI0950554.1 hypothetical protein AcV7_008982 [Antrodia cinnamomea]
MSSRQRTATSSARREESKYWTPHDSDSDRPRQTMATTQRHNIDGHRRHHTASRRAVTADVPASPAPGSSHKLSSRDRSSTAPVSSYYPTTQTQNYATWNGTPVDTSSARARMQDNSNDTHGLRGYFKRKSEKQSPWSSTEQVPPLDEGRSTRPSAMPRSAHTITASTTVQAPTSTQASTAAQPSTTRDPSAPSRHHRERDKDREKAERRREEKERDKDRERERRRADKEKEREKERERERRRERENEKDRSAREKHPEKSRDRESRRREAFGAADLGYATQVQPSVSSTPQRERYVGEKQAAVMNGRYSTQIPQPGSFPPTDQAMPSGSMNYVPAATQFDPNVHLGGGTRPTAPSEHRRDDPPARAAPLYLPDRDKVSSRHHRSHRDRATGQQSGQESGVSSSEQEYTAKERRISDRRYAPREHNADGHPSGPSGSETERTATRERRKVGRTQGEPHRPSRTAAVNEPGSRPANAQLGGPQQPSANHQELANAWHQQARQTSHTRESPSHRPLGSAQLPASGMPMHASVPPTGQPTLPGPADPQTPIVLTKNPSTAAGSRPYDPPPTERAAMHEATSRSQAASHIPQQPPQQGATTQSYGSSIPVSNPAMAYQSVHPADAPGRSHPGVSSVQQAAAPSNFQQSAQLNYGYSHVSGNAPSSLHPVQQAIRSVEGIVRPPSTRPPSTVPVAHYVTASTMASSNGPMATTNGPTTQSYGPPSSVPQPQAMGHQAGYIPSSSNDMRSHGHRSTAAHSANPSQGQSHMALSGVGSPGTQPVNQQSYSPTRNINLEVQRTPAPPAMQLNYSNADVISSAPGVSGVNSRAVGSTSAPTATPIPPRQTSTYPTQTDEKANSAQPPVVSIQYFSSTYPTNASGQVHDPRDPRSPKPPSILPPTTQSVTVAQATFPSSRSHPKEVPVQSSAANPNPSSHSAYRHNNASITPVSAPSSQNPPAPVNNSVSYSPLRNMQSSLTRSPGVTNIVPPAATPKQSPSGRLHSHRNGSNDTITQSPAPKPSPNPVQQPLGHHSSTTNLQTTASLRPDMNSASRPSNATSGYPEPARYRSPAPSTYPQSQVVSSTQHVSTSTVHLPHHLQSYSTQTPTSSSRPTLPPANSAPSYDYSYNTQRGFTTQMAPSGPSQSIASRSDPHHMQSSEYVIRPQDPVTVSSNSAAGQRVPPRSAPSPVPTINARQYHNVSSRTPSTVPPSSTQIQPLRNNTYPTTTSRRPDPSPFPNPSHSRAASDPQYTHPGRVAVSGHPSTPSPSKAQLAPRTTPSQAPEPDVLLTPSSLAPSMLPRQLSNASTSGPATARSSKEKPPKEKETRKLGGLFGLFRSRSSPPRPQEPRAAPVTSDRQRQRSRKVSAPAVSSTTTNGKSSTTAVPPPVTSPVRATPNTMQIGGATMNGVGRAPEQVDFYARRNPIATPIPVPATSGRRSPGLKMFTPFRLLSRRHRTVSAASVEAVDGTAANTVLTGADSTRSSTAGRPSPPLRDPMVAAREWRNKEEAELTGRGTLRIRRPGVTFDVEEDLPEASQPQRRPPRRRQVQEE